MTASFDAEELFGLYRLGLYLQVKARGESFGPLPTWPGIEGQKLAGRLAAVLGAQRLGAAIAIRFLRRQPDEPAAVIERVGDLLQQERPLEATQLLEAAHPDAWPSAERGEAFLLRALAHAVYRDFERAHASLDAAFAACDPTPFHLVTRTMVLREGDRYDEAVESARELLHGHPYYGPGVLHLADLLTLRGAHDESVALLQDALQHTENGLVALHLARNWTLLDRHADALDALERYEQLSPLLEPKARRALAAQRADRAYDLGDRPRSIAWARESASPYHEAIADALEAAPARARRRELDVTFVRQHHMTCVPATLSMLARYFDRPAEHLSIAEEICYGGTTSYAERTWAQEHGFHAREFRVTWEGAKELIDRSLPFTITTVYVTSGHLQAIVGYDEARGTLLVRDPYHPDDHEARAEPFLEAYAASGPRGMALVPVERREELDALELVDAHLYDQLFAIEQALQRHDRDGAYALYERLRDDAPEDPCTIRARYALSGYDRDSIGVLACIERLLERWPQNAMLQFQKLQTLASLGRDVEVRAMLLELCEEGPALPAFQRELARFEALDPATRGMARRRLRTALRQSPREARAYQLLASFEEDTGRRKDGLALRRIAATLEDTREDLALSYYQAARDLGRVDEGLAFLEARFERALGRSGGPAESFVMALAQGMEGERALGVIERSAAARPEDGEHLVALAGWLADLGHVTRAREFLERARAHASRVTIARQEARLAWMHADFRRALTGWRTVLDVDPVDVLAHERVAELLELTEGRTAACEHLQSAVDAFPFHGILLRAAARFFGDREPDRALALLEPLQEDRPFDAWLHRERALRFIDLRRFDDALQAALTARDLDPEESASHHILGLAYQRLDRREEAEAALREALTKDADGLAIYDLVIDQEKQLESLTFQLEQLVAQPGKTDGIHHAGQLARQVLDVPVAETFLKRLTECLPDTWQAWTEWLAHRLSGQGAPEGTLEEAERCVERFPGAAPLWRILGELRGRVGDLDGRRAAFERACQLRPDWSTPFLQLAEIHERDGDFHASRAILERVVVQDPGSARNHAWLADALLSLGDRERALEHVRIALTFQPDHEFAWDLLRRLERALEREALVADTAREVARRRPGSALSWKVLARRLGEHPTDRFQERREALQRAQELDPLDFEAFDLEVELLFEVGAWSDAEDAWREGATRFGGRVDYTVRGVWFPWIAGRREEAVGALRAILEEHPGHAAGFELLANWLEETNDRAGYLEATRRLAVLVPNGLAFARLAHAARVSGENVEAGTALERAFALIPADAWVGERFVEHALQEKDVEKARQRLEVVRRHQAGWHVERLALRIALQAKQLDEAAKRLKTALLATERTVDEAREAIQDFYEHSCGARAERVLKGLASREEGPAFLGELWVESVAGHGAFVTARRRLNHLSAGSAMHTRACGRLIAALADARKGRDVQALLRRHGAALRDDEVASLDVATALSMLRKYRQLVDWLEPTTFQYRRRPLVALLRANALRALSRWEEARVVTTEGVTFPSDGITSWLRLWLAAHHLLDGDVVAARGQIGFVSKADLNAYHGYFLEHLLATTEMLECEPAHRDRLAKEIIERLRRAADEYPNHRNQKSLRVMTRALAHARGGSGSWNDALRTGPPDWLSMSWLERRREKRAFRVVSGRNA